MNRLRRLLAALTLTTTMVVFAGPLPAQADDASPTNAAVAVNTKDGSSVFRLAFTVRRITGDVVNPQNAAVAYASCTDCRTIAIAVQIVLVDGSPSTFAPTNEAIAINELCDLCETLATAYQFVLQDSGPMRLTGEGRQRLAEIRHQLQELARSDLSAIDTQARVDALADQIADVLATQLVPIPGGDDQRDEESTTTTVSGPSSTMPSDTSSATTAPTTSTTSRTGDDTTTTTEQRSTSTTSEPTSSSAQPTTTTAP